MEEDMVRVFECKLKVKNFVMEFEVEAEDEEAAIEKMWDLLDPKDGILKDEVYEELLRHMEIECE